MNNQNGSIFFYILLGVALFAALSFAVVQSNRLGSGSTENLTKDKMELNYVELTNFFEALKLRVYQLEYLEGIKETNIDFKTSKYLFANNVENCWNDNNANTANYHVFSPNSTNGIQPINFDSIASTLAQSSAGRPKNGHLQVGSIIVQNVGSPAPEMVIMIAGISPTFCNFYNAKQGITTDFTDTSTMESIGEVTLASRVSALGGCGTGALFNSTNSIGDGYSPFISKKTFCAPMDYNTFSPTLRILYVVKAR